MTRKLRKSRKFRGSRTCGYGRQGQHRKTSQKGGRNVGRHKGLWTYVLRHEPDYFGKKGFRSVQSLHRKVNVINVGELGSLAEKLEAQNQLERKDGKIMLDLEKLGYTKLLGTGKATESMLVKISSYSASAAKKIEEAGGQILAEPSTEPAETVKS
ncbi:MAG: uL15 family ribosomal protein [Candidatus Bathyarchaeia archaeon]|nr:50S ribosomal protein L15 [Candidatus Bathyarchaeota archaeon A05DMB-4]MDH7595624.1 uL15 family ribosomal protein [Candidatus Bathyarchaeota archaeon]